MYLLAILNLGHKPAACFGKSTHAASKEALPPLMLRRVGALGALPRANTDEYPNLSPGPFIDCGLFEKLRCRVVLASAFVMEDGVPNLDRFERQSHGAGGPTSLPYRTVELRSRLLSRVITAQEDGGTSPGIRSLVDGCYGAIVFS